MKARHLVPLLILGVGVFARAFATHVRADAAIPYDRLAQRIVASLKVVKGERVLLRYDPKTLGPLEAPLRTRLVAQGASVETLNYGPASDLAERLARTDIYIWLPAGEDAPTDATQRELLARWLDEGRGRQIHFHWSGGTVDPDGLPGVHAAAFDEIYVEALDIDYRRLAASQEKAIAKLRAGEVRVTTPDGVDLRFEIGDRPFNRQDGDASKARMASARVRVDREIELPAGVVRVAPLESTVRGVIVIPAARLGTEKATGIRLEIEKGRVTKASAQTGDAALQAFLQSAPGATQFREIGIGFNPKLTAPAGSTLLPYYGYGDAVVRLSLGDNTEVGGAVRGGGIRWFFFPKATVTAADSPIVRNGRLTDDIR
jgi:hypothetical protein